jgi:hypothetical protein
LDNQALRDYFKFDEADLAANRNGGLTEKQKMKLVKDNKSSKTFGIGCGIGGGFFLIAIASIFPIVFIPMGLSSLQEHEMDAATSAFIAAAVWALVWGGFGIVAIVWGIKSGTKDRTKVLLKKAAGPINLVGIERTGEHGHTYIDHELHIGREEFDVDEEVAGFMMQGDLYAVYYIENMDGSGQQVMSVEHLSK